MPEGGGRASGIGDGMVGAIGTGGVSRLRLVSGGSAVLSG